MVSVSAVALTLSGCSDDSETRLTGKAEERFALLGKEVERKPEPAATVKTADASAGGDVVVEPAKPAVAQEVIDKAIADGKASYVTCMACHQATGLGLPGMFPPLAKSDWVNGLANDELAAIVLQGLTGPIKVNGVDYPGAIPMASLAAAMDDQKIADVLTYVKNEWGNEGGYVSPDEVKAVRAATEGKPMLTAGDIKGLENLNK